MATKTKKPFEIKSILMAAGGGVAAGVITTGLEKNIAFLADKPKVTPLIIGVVAGAGLYFLPDEYSPAFFGMVGAAGGDLGMQFISDRNTTKSMMEDQDFYLPEVEDEDNLLIAQNLELPIATKEGIMSEDEFWQSEAVA